MSRITSHDIGVIAKRDVRIIVAPILLS